MSEERLGDLVDSALRTLGARQAVREAQVRDAFAEMVGPQLSEICRAVSLERGVLCVATSHGALAQQLHADSPALIAELNRRIGSDAIRRLRFVPQG